jgi:hypothetical protein
MKECTNIMLAFKLVIQVVCMIPYLQNSAIAHADALIEAFVQKLEAKEAYCFEVS